MKEIVVGVDIGSHKIATIVGEVRPQDIFIIGSGVVPSRGLRRGRIYDLPALSQAIAASVLEAESVSGYEIGRAYLNLSDGEISFVNSQGAIGLNSHRSINANDLDRVLENARAIAIPHNAEILHVLPRNYSLDGRENVQSPIGMHGFRLELETHIVTAQSSALANLRQALQSARVHTDRILLSGLAAANCVLDEEAAMMGTAVIDFGAGTTDLALFIDGSVWHTAVIPLGSALITQDISYFLRTSFEVAEQVKLRYGYARQKEVDAADSFVIQTILEGQPQEIRRSELAMVVEARSREIFEMVKLEIKRSGYSGMLRAGVLLTGGGAELLGLRQLVAEILGIPVRVVRPERLSGNASGLQKPAFSTSVGLLSLGLEMNMDGQRHSANGAPKLFPRMGSYFQGLLKRLLPETDWR